MVEPSDQLLEGVLDFPDLLVRVDEDRELLRELLVLFLEESPNLIASLSQAVSCADMKHIESSSHTLKGMLANLSATRAASAASELEELGRAGRRSELNRAFLALGSEIATLSPKLDEFLRETR